MRILYFTLGLALFLHAGPSYAGNAEARETARLNNCSPKKIQIYEQKLGTPPTTIYRIDCTPPKAVGPAQDKVPTAILVECDAGLCRMMRSLKD